MNRSMTLQSLIELHNQNKAWVNQQIRSILANRQKFADTFRITIEQVDQLINLVTIAEKTQTNYHNGNASEEQANKAVAKVEEFATNVMKAETQWPDLFPLFSFNGKQYELPE